MTTRSTRAKPGPGEELIGTITPHGIRLTRAALRAQRAYRDRERERAETPTPRHPLTWLAGRNRPAGQGQQERRTSHRSVELRISWSSDAPFRLHVAVARWLVPPAPSAVGVPERDEKPKPPRRESTSRLEAAANRGRRSERVAMGPGEGPAPELETARGSRARTRPR